MRWPLCIILYVPLRWVPGWSNALDRSFFPGVIFLDLSVRTNPERAKIIRHGLQHQRQIWRYFVVGFWVLYTFSPKWRERFEAEALGAE